MTKYQEIAESLVRGLSIAEGERVVPSENDLCQRCGASRTTGRAALKQLQNQGLIERRHGVGTFHRPRPITQNLGRLVDFRTETQLAGRVPRTVVIALTKRAARPEEEAQFGAEAAPRA